jgi:DNA-binding PadR family transcriptional regulator
MSRRKVAKSVETDVLVSSRRRCCLCYGLRRDLQEKRGQIAHLDRNNENNAQENLAFLCLEHHDQYDTRTSQSKNYTIAEVKRYRSELYSALLTPVPVAKVTQLRDSARFEAHSQQEAKSALKELLSENPYAGQNLTYIASRLSLSRRAIEQLLYLLSKDGMVRIERKPGTTKKTYSLTSSKENRLIDAFVASLPEHVEVDRRFVRSRTHEIDAIVRTTCDLYAVEVMWCPETFSSHHAMRRIETLDEAMTALRVDRARKVLVIGVSSGTTQSDFELRRIEESGVLVKIVELE